jgi:hypothetical protein
MSMTAEQLGILQTQLGNAHDKYPVTLIIWDSKMHLKSSISLPLSLGPGQGQSSIVVRVLLCLILLLSNGIKLKGCSGGSMIVLKHADQWIIKF